MINTKKHLPRFSDLKIDELDNKLSQLLANNMAQTDKILTQPPLFNWDNLMQPLEDLDDQIHHFWSPVSHLHGVLDSEALRKAYNTCIPKLTEYETKYHHNEKLFNAISSLVESKDFSTLNEAQKKVIENEIRDFRLSGVNLAPFQKERYAALSTELAQLTTKFEENVLDATQGWIKNITDEKLLQGLPEFTKKSAQKAAQKRNLTGWLLSLDAPSYLAVMKYADDAKLREEMYFAFTTRASDQGPNAGKWDNSSIMQDILKHRLEGAQLLGFNNYAELSLATKMAKTPAEVLDFLNQLVQSSLAKAKQEIQELKDFAREKYQHNNLEVWDVPYFTEKLRQERYSISQEDLRPYFPEERVLNGLFAIVNKLFDIRIEEIHDFDSWCPEQVRCFALFDEDNKLRSYFYIDLYARENKRGGAWMDECRVRKYLADGNIQIPVAFVNCNFNPPVGNKHSLFTHDEVVTLFHEFGHALQHMLTTINYAGVSGINGIPWDAVEVASQFLENWAWEKESLQLISSHHETGENIPDALYEKMLAAQNFQSGLLMLRQLEFALFDFRLHSEFDPTQENQISNILSEVRTQVSVMKAPKFNRFQHSFSHIFAGGYAAGYYSYKWAEVMAADAFSLFKEKGIFNKSVSKKFLHTFLESGGARDPMELFIEFRGRKPEVKSLLQQSGIID